MKGGDVRGGEMKGVCEGRRDEGRGCEGRRDEGRV